MENNKTALLIMDMQMGILSRMEDQGKSLITTVARAIDTARKNDVLVIYVRLGFQKGLPEISPANNMFYGLRKHLLDEDALNGFMEIPAGLGITDRDIVINKKRVSAFTGNELEMILRAAGISHLTLTGVATSGIVLSTFTEAFDKDYQLTVLSDCCADSDEEVHQFLLNRIFSKRAAVMTSVQFEEQYPAR